MYETKVYLDTTVTLTPKDNKTDTVFEFEVSEDNDAMYLDTAYAPKFFYDRAISEQLVEDSIQKYGLDPETDLFDCTADSAYPLANMVVLSLDINDVYRGAAHRHANAQHIVLSERQATSGFASGRPPKGKWRIVVHAFCVLTEQCDYHITVTGVRKQGTESECDA